MDMAQRGSDVGWKVTAEIAENDIETWSDGQSGRQVRINGKTAPQSSLGQLQAVVWLVPSMDRLWTEGAEGRRRFLDRISLSFQPDHAEATLAYEKAMRERNRLLKDQVRDWHWYDALEAQMAKSGTAISSGRAAAIAQLAEAQANVETAFPTADLLLVGPDGNAVGSWEEGDLNEALNRSRMSDMAAGRTLVGPHRTDLSAVYTAKGIPARESSTGEQKALLISLVLANARALIGAGKGAPIILLDEVAAHLDEHRRGALYEELDSLNAQAWMTGTGPELFAGLEEKTSFLRVSERAGQSVVEHAN